MRIVSADWVVPVEGEPIDRYCETRQLDVAARERLLRQVCEAVEYAHRHLVVHRDLKPGNILVDEGGVVKLLDFGIAKFVEEGADDTAGDLTRLGGRMMTLRYAAPEQVAADEGVGVAVLDPVEGLSKGADGDYFSVLRSNLEALRSANQC